MAKGVVDKVWITVFGIVSTILAPRLTLEKVLYHCIECATQSALSFNPFSRPVLACSRLKHLVAQFIQI